MALVLLGQGLAASASTRVPPIPPNPLPAPAEPSHSMETNSRGSAPALCRQGLVQSLPQLLEAEGLAQKGLGTLGRCA